MNINSDGLEAATIAFCDSYPSAYVADMLHDWLFRGYDSVNQFFSPSTYTNVYLQLESPQGVRIAGTNRIPVPRSTAEWTAPAAYGAATIPVMQITNVNLLDFGTTTATITGQYCWLSAYMSPTAQAFTDRLAMVTASSLFTCVPGDSLTIPAGQLAIQAGRP